MRERWLCLLFCFSGTSALVYELVWQRLLNLLFGVSTLSVSAVLAAFMGGLALGGLFLGRLADRVDRPLRLYACLEAGIGATAMLVPAAFAGIRWLYPWLYAYLEPSPWTGTLLRFVLASLILIVPATLLGGTLPVMGRLVLSRSKGMPAAFSLLYSANTFGAVLGASLTGFVLLRYLGMQQTLWLAVCLNFGVALAATLLREPRGNSGVESIEKATPPAGVAVAGIRVPATLAMAAVTGATSMGLEVVWTRILGILTSNSAYGFALLLTIMLLGIGFGSLLQLRWCRRAGDSWFRLALCQYCLAGITLVSVPFFRTSPAWLDRWCDGSSAARVFFGEMILTAAALFIPAVLMGLSLPLLVNSVARESKRFARSIGRIYSANTLGCVAGAFLTGFIVIPWLGIHGTVGVILASILAVSAIAWCFADGVSRHARFAGAALPGVLLAAIWVLLPPGIYLKSAVVEPRKLLLYAEGNNATVSVLQEFDGTRSIFVDGQPVAGTSGTSQVDQKMLAHLPLLLHPEPHRALTVGFGSGGTSYSMSLHGIEVDCVEIESRVAAASHLFEGENHGILGHPTFRLIVDDARSWLQVAPRPYDVIVTDCTNIQYRSNGDLYTTDYFQLMKGRLTPAGVAAAWVPANGINEGDLKTLLRSFHAVFPHTSIWYMNSLPTDFLVVVGTPATLEINFETLSRRMALPEVSQDLSEVGLEDPLRFLFTFLLDEESLGKYLGTGPVNTDDRPVLSYSTYGATFQSTIAANLSQLLAYRGDVTNCVTHVPSRITMLRHYAASTELILGHIAHLAGADDAALPHYRRGAELLPGDSPKSRLHLPGLEIFEKD